MTTPLKKDGQAPRARDAGAADSTLELQIDDGSASSEFDAPTQLVDPTAYANTMARADGGVPTQEDHPPEAPRSASRRAVEIEAPPSAQGRNGLPDLPHVQLPQKLGEYTLIELLGLGGMAEVFLAQQNGVSGFQRKLVIKRIHPHLSVDERFVQMFLREARVAAGLQHRNIVRIDELGEDRGVYFIAMEHVDGITLLRLARRAWRNGLSLPMELAIAAAADAASALHYAHSYLDDDGTPRRIVHRDVSPDNLMVDRAGDTKLLDFGVAKAAGSISVTRAGEVKGKVPYMAPEQLHGKPLDGRADLYSLGATMYWLMTGRRPFYGETDLEVMQAIAYEAPIPPRELNPEIPEVVERIVLRLLSKKPSDRHADGQELAEDLSSMLPPSRREITSFVEEVLALDHIDDSDPVSNTSFIAATPRTAHFVTESRRIWLQRFLPEESQEGLAVDLSDEADDIGEEVTAIDAQAIEQAPLTDAALAPAPSDAPPSLDAIAAPQKGRLGIALGAGVGGAALLALVGALLFAPDDPPPPATVAVLPQAATDVATEDADPWQILGTEEAPKPKPEPKREPPPSEPAPATEVAVAAEPSAEPPAEDAPTLAAASEPEDEAAPVEEVNEAPAEPTATATPAAKTEARPVPKPASAQKRAPATKTVSAKAPSAIVWKLGKKTLGRGDASFEVPEGTTSLTAVHRTRGVSTRIPLNGQRVSYADAPMGTLDIRVFPYATVFAGKDRLWKVPGPPGEVPAGTYKLRLEYEGKTRVETVTVEAGKVAKVRVNMSE